MTTSPTLPHVRFAQRERRGAFLGLSWPQLTVICATAAASVMWLLINWDGYWRIGIWPAATSIAVGSWTWHRESGLALIWRVLTYAARRHRLQTSFRRDVWDSRKDEPMKIGTKRRGAEDPREVHRHRLPGAHGSLRFVQVPGRGGFILDPKRSLVSFSVDVLSSAWPLLDEGVQQAAYDGFVGWMSGLEAVPGLVDATARIRVDAKPADELARYAAERDRTDPSTVSPAARAEYDTLITAGADRSMQFTNTVTVSCDLRSLRSAIKHSGGGLVGIAAIVTDLVEQMRDSLEAIGVELRNWLDTEVIDEMLALAMNPTSFAAESRNDGPNRLAPVMGIEERWDHVQIDGSVHRTYWIAEWPRSEISVGFLDKLLYSGDSTRVLTLSVRPVPTHKALSQVGRAKVDLEVARGLRQRRGMITTREQDREYEDLGEREDDIVDGFTDMEFRGFVTVSAADVDGLTRASASILQAAQPARVTLAAMYFQQAAAFMSTALPTPVGKR